MKYENIIIELIKTTKNAMDHIGYIAHKTDDPRFALEYWLITFLDNSVSCDINITSLIDFLVGSADIDYDYIIKTLSIDKLF